uniref:DNA-directed RNA polymerase I subunit D n=1 Tax=Plectus sambesii TaxID=2011161 RepID=A0A914UKS1_9BILA
MATGDTKKNAAEAATSKVEVLDKATYEDDPSCLTIVFHEEDHTIGNSLKHIISRYPEVEFCGYNVPHPLEDKILFRIQTKEGHNAGDCLKRGLKELEQIFGAVRRTFENRMGEFEGKIDV